MIIVPGRDNTLWTTKIWEIVFTKIQPSLSWYRRLLYNLNKVFVDLEEDILAMEVIHSNRANWLCWWIVSKITVESVGIFGICATGNVMLLITDKLSIAKWEDWKSSAIAGVPLEVQGSHSRRWGRRCRVRLWGLVSLEARCLLFGLPSLYTEREKAKNSWVNRQRYLTT